MINAPTDAPDTFCDQPENLLPARKPYEPPAITCELQLETRAGSPLTLVNPLNMLDPRPKI